MPISRDVPNTSPFLSNHPSLRDCLQPDSQLSDRCRQYRFLDPALSPPSWPSVRKQIGTQSVLQSTIYFGQCYLFFFSQIIYMQQTIYRIDNDEKNESSILIHFINIIIYIYICVCVISISYPSHIHVLKVCPETRHEDTEYSRGLTTRPLPEHMYDQR